MSIFEDLISTNKESVRYSDGFLCLGVSKYIVNILSKESIEKPTEIQKQVLPTALKGSDIFACAQTGSGKTLAYAIPLIQRMLLKPKISKTTRALVIIPTRELALQVFQVIKTLANVKLSVSLIIGGLNAKSQESELRRGADILVCTPGRLIDHLYNCPTFCIENIEILILDEADRLLDDNFKGQLEEIVRFSSKHKQTILLSATLTEEVKLLASIALKNPVKIFSDSAASMVTTLKQQFVKISNDDLVKREALTIDICEMFPDDAILVFCNTKFQTHRLFVLMKLLHFSVSELHGNMSQVERNFAMDEFRSEKTRILVSTSLSSRGLDIERINIVVNFNIPITLDEYVHRVGRTARAGRFGCSITIFCAEERKYWKQITRGAKKQFSALEYDKDVCLRHQKDINDILPRLNEAIKEDRFKKELCETHRDLESANNALKFENEIKNRPVKSYMKKMELKHKKNGEKTKLKKEIVEVKKMKKIFKPKSLKQ